ncbi:polyketide cyclase [Gordonia sp. CNJ-863]|uniref:SRPBCC family protein n=1 Tax=Gordonia TaxID=2053 RepID=UPI0004AD6EE5|nr:MULTISPECIES: SRPBCC domain-containing protein [Gordonia]MDH3015352.1 SRPBCC domain-containing protein [Gordonia alkanivorans]MDH3059619.1 SRPBCC domain-containing protein [Gordonia alkanivorans]OLT42955.1 polyketide cyclase [Gordonia sp. CNJ-863]
MPVIDVTPDLDARTITINAEFAAPVERVWQIYADPRQLEKIWGPPTYPATFVDHEFKPGGKVTYYMTSPEGEKFGGYWEIESVDEPHGFTFLDGFADADLNPLTDMPESRNSYAFVEKDGKTVATYISTYDSAEALQKVLDMGVVEGATSAINQIDEFLNS